MSYIYSAALFVPLQNLDTVILILTNDHDN